MTTDSTPTTPDRIEADQPNKLQRFWIWVQKRAIYNWLRIAGVFIYSFLSNALNYIVLWVGTSIVLILHLLIILPLRFLYRKFIHNGWQRFQRLKEKTAIHACEYPNCKAEFKVAHCKTIGKYICPKHHDLMHFLEGIKATISINKQMDPIIGYGIGEVIAEYKNLLYPQLKMDDVLAAIKDTNAFGMATLVYLRFVKWYLERKQEEESLIEH